MPVALQLEPMLALPSVEYRWDDVTRILSADLALDRPAGAPRSLGVSGSVEVEGEDGSWLTLDLDDGCVRGVHVAIWPAVRRRPALRPPAAPLGRARLSLPSGASRPMVLSLEVNTSLRAESDHHERNFHFVLGPSRSSAKVAIATDIVLELDDTDILRGLWLLNVPPSPISA